MRKQLYHTLLYIRAMPVNWMIDMSLPLDREKITHGCNILFSDVFFFFLSAENAYVQINTYLRVSLQTSASKKVT